MFGSDQMNLNGNSKKIFMKEKGIQAKEDSNFQKQVRYTRTRNFRIKEFVRMKGPGKRKKIEY